MGIQSRNIRIPVDLHRRIVMIARQREQSESRHLIQPVDHCVYGGTGGWDCGNWGTPLHFIVARAISEYEAHRRRSSYAARKAARERRQNRLI